MHPTTVEKGVCKQSIPLLFVENAVGVKLIFINELAIAKSHYGNQTCKYYYEYGHINDF